MQIGTFILLTNSLTINVSNCRAYIIVIWAISSGKVHVYYDSVFRSW